MDTGRSGLAIARDSKILKTTRAAACHDLDAVGGETGTIAKLC